LYSPPEIDYIFREFEVFKSIAEDIDEYIREFVIDRFQEKLLKAG
jgi:hypothetical protein